MKHQHHDYPARGGYGALWGQPKEASSLPTGGAVGTGGWIYMYLILAAENCLKLSFKVV